MLIVQVEGESNVPVANTTLLILVLFVNDINEVFNVLFVGVSYTKLVNNKGKHQVLLDMFPQLRGYGTGYIAKGIKERLEAVVGKIACLGESVYPFLHLRVEVFIGDLGFKFVEVDDSWRHKMNGNGNVLIICEVSSQIKVFQIQCNKADVESDNNAVE